MSDKVTATLIQPISNSVIPFGKSVVSWSMSVLETRILPSPKSNIEQSSAVSASPIKGRIVSSSFRSSIFGLLHLFLTFFSVCLKNRTEDIFSLRLFFLYNLLRFFWNSNLLLNRF